MKAPYFTILQRKKHLRYGAIKEADSKALSNVDNGRPDHRMPPPAEIREGENHAFMISYLKVRLFH
jgi:hypothetical protein